MLLTGCNTRKNADGIPDNVNPVYYPEYDMGSEANQLKSVSDVIENCNTIIIAEFIGISETVGRGNGTIIVDGREYDNNTYYAKSEYKVEKVLKGNDNLVGTVITVYEYIGAGDYTFEPVSEQLEESRRIAFLNYDEEEQAYWISRSDARVHILNNNKITYSTLLEEVDEYKKVKDIERKI